MTIQLNDYANVQNSKYFFLVKQSQVCKMTTLHTSSFVGKKNQNKLT